MNRMELAKKFYAQAQRMTIGMAASVVAYGAIGFYLISIGKAGPSLLTAQTYPLAKYGALVLSVLGVFAMWKISNRIFSPSQGAIPASERPVQKIFLKTVLMNAGAELPLLLGMLLVFFGRKPYDYIPFAVVSLAGFALAFPKKEQWTSWLGADF
ncbi:MAG: hypothetical protein WCJ71_03735 [Candidatus Omnitrophota bacterium]